MQTHNMNAMCHGSHKNTKMSSLDAIKNINHLSATYDYCMYKQALAARDYQRSMWQAANGFSFCYMRLLVEEALQTLKCITTQWHSNHPSYPHNCYATVMIVLCEAACTILTVPFNIIRPV